MIQYYLARFFNKFIKSAMLFNIAFIGFLLITYSTFRDYNVVCGTWEYPYGLLLLMASFSGLPIAVFGSIGETLEAQKLEILKRRGQEIKIKATPVHAKKMHMIKIPWYCIGCGIWTSAYIHINAERVELKALLDQHHARVCKSGCTDTPHLDLQKLTEAT